jgi:RimJ/RimL family protein N-acetyltransferase
MKLVDVYEYEGSKEILYKLLAERDEHVNISHKEMPTWEQHCEFVSNIPYREWYIILNEANTSVGACYLTYQNEIGVFVFKRFQKMGCGGFAIQSLIYRHPSERLLANVAPHNTVSQELFKGFGFRLCQHTYELSPKVSVEDENVGS